MRRIVKRRKLVRYQPRRTFKKKTLLQKVTLKRFYDQRLAHQKLFEKNMAHIYSMLKNEIPQHGLNRLKDYQQEMRISRRKLGVWVNTARSQLDLVKMAYQGWGYGQQNQDGSLMSVRLQGNKEARRQSLHRGIQSNITMFEKICISQQEKTMKYDNIVLTSRQHKNPRRLILPKICIKERKFLSAQPSTHNSLAQPYLSMHLKLKKAIKYQKELDEEFNDEKQKNIVKNLRQRKRRRRRRKKGNKFNITRQRSEKKLYGQFKLMINEHMNFLSDQAKEDNKALQKAGIDEEEAEEEYFLTDLRKALKQKQFNSKARIFLKNFVKQIKDLNILKLRYGDQFQNEWQQKVLHLNKKPYYLKKKTLIFDLDETLIHCQKKQTYVKSDYLFQIEETDGSKLLISLNIRPYVRELFESLYKDFEIIVFTASSQGYADRILDILDPEGKYIQHRVYRDNCVQTPIFFIKDLRILESKHRLLKNIILVDNSIASFCYQTSNGVPITPFIEGKKDDQLLKLIPYIKFLDKSDDIQDVNYKKFHIKDYSDLFRMQDIINRAMQLLQAR